MSLRVLAALACCAILPAACTTSAPVAYGTAVTPPGSPPASPPPPFPGDGVPDGSWAYTDQYGWIWMPYGDSFTYIPANGSGEPLEFVFNGSVGWTWVAAPWVWGRGPSPWFGRRGPGSFGWYRRGDWRTPQRWNFVPGREPPGVPLRGVRSPPPYQPGGTSRGGGGQERGGGGGGTGDGVEHGGY